MRSRDRAAVAGDHRDVTDALAAQPLDDPLGVRAQLVRHHDHAAEVAVDADEHVRLAGPPAAHHGRRRDLLGRDAARRAGTPGFRPRRGARRRAPSMPCAGLLAHIASASSSSRPASAAARTSASPSTCADIRSTEAARRSSSAGVQPSRVRISRTSGVPTVSVPVLSNRTVRACAERLDRPGALDDHARARGPRERRDERDRRGEDQRAGRRDHDDRERPDGVAAQRPCRRRRASSVAGRKNPA